MAEPTADQKLFDEVISQALDLLRLSAGERKKVQDKLSKMSAELADRLANDDIGDMDREELEDFLSKTDDLIGSHYTDIEDTIDLPDLASVVSNGTASGIEVALGKDTAKVVSKDYAAAIESEALIEGAPIKDWWAAQSDDFKLKFKAQVRQGLINAETNQQIITRIVGKSGESGIIDIARRNAATLVQTSVQAVANTARRETFQKNKDIIKGLKQVSTLDSHTSIICVSYSGAEWDLDYEPINGNTLPFNGGTPRHFNCRSVEVPITKTFRDLGIDIDEAPVSTRASVDGQISADTTMSGFLNRKNKAFQDEVLGEGKADLFRQGKISLRDLVSGDGRPLSLEEIKAGLGRGFKAANYAAKYNDANVTPANIIAKFPKDTQSKLDAVKVKLASLPDTAKANKVNGEYTAERLKLHDDIFYNGVQGYDEKTGGTKFIPGLFSEERLKASIPTDTKPVFTLLGGRGGSGKSSLAGLVYDKSKNLVLNSDDIKAMLPEFEGYNANQVHQESDDILQEALKLARDYKANVVLDGTLKSDKTELAKAFIDNGYDFELHYMFLPRQKAAERAIQRFLGPTGRLVPPEVILGNVDNEANFDTLRELAKDWSFRDNDVARNEAPRLIAEYERPS